MTDYYNASGVLMPTTPWSPTQLNASWAGQTVTGTNANEQLGDISGGATLVGGGGDDTYSIIDDKSKIVEQPNGGIDTINSYASLKMSDNVENLVLGGNQLTAIGNSLGNLMQTWGSQNTLNGGAGNDVLVDLNASASNTFAFNAGSGRDVLYGFTATGANADHIKISDYGFYDFSQVKSHLSQVGADTLLTFDSNDSVLLKNVQASSLTASDFYLQIDPSKLTMTFDDEFNSLSLWNPSTGTGTWKTNYFFGAQSGSNAYTSRASGDDLSVAVDPSFAGTSSKSLGLNPFSISNGVVTINTQAASAAALPYLSGYKYTTGMLTTEKTFAQTYGYFEVRAQLPQNQPSMWPTFWLLRQDQKPGEADVMEFMGGPGIYETVHSFSSGSDVETHSNTFDPALLTGMHTYGMLWTKSTISFYIDGTEISSEKTPADMNSPMYMLITSGLSPRFAAPTNFTDATLKIDYVRAYSLNSNPVTPPVTTPPVTTPPVTTPTSYYTAQFAYDHAVGTKDVLYSNFDNTLIGTTAHTLQLTGTGDFVGFGNDLGDHLIGNSGNNQLLGGKGADVISGGLGNDRLTGGGGKDTFVFIAGGGHDTIVDAQVSDQIDLSAILAKGGKASISTVSGEVVITMSTGEIVTVDGIKAAQLHQDSIGYDVVALTTATAPSAPSTPSSPSSSSYAVAHWAWDNTTGGKDALHSSYDNSLGGTTAHTLVLTGTGDIQGRGNDLGDTIVGNSGNNSLTGGKGNDYIDGGSGADYMVGGAGNDTYIVDNVKDTIFDSSGHDLVKSSVSYSLGSGLEDLTLTGTGNISGTGNALANIITGNSGNNVLTGGSGADTFVFAGKFGHDTIQDFTAGTASGHDTLQISKALFGNYSQLMAHSKQVGSDVVITYDANDSITLHHMTLGTLNQADFHFV